MRVLLVTHLFPPRHTAGTEVYAEELGRRLASRGHDVAVFTTDKDIGRTDLSVEERSHAGLRVFELTNNLFLEEFRETWDRPEIVAAFGRVLDQCRPDVVHVHHLLYLSAGCLAEAKERGVAVLFTLHDFWLECPRMGQLVHADGSICHDVDFARCGTCLPSFKWRQTDLERRTGKAIAKMHSVTGVDLGPVARGVARLAHGHGGDNPWREPPREEAEVYTRVARARFGQLRAAALAHVDRFVSPSLFLRDRFVRWGIPAERIVHVPTGIDREAFEARPQSRTRAERLRVGFFGTLVPLKGAHVLIDAWSRIPEDLRGRGELVLHGSKDHAPEYVAALERSAADVGARLPGRLERDAVPDALAVTDVVVVPSTWYENRPLVVLEALSAGVPVIASDLGGMAELVEEGVHGWRFPAGDAEALGGRLGSLLADRAPLDALDADASALPSWDELADAMVALYSDALEGGEATGGETR